MKALIAVLLACVCTQTTAVTCGTETLDGVPVDWCVYSGPNSDPQTRLYYLHGNGGDAESFGPAWDDLVTRWTTAGATTYPTGVSVSYGPKWTLSDMPSAYVAGAPVLWTHFYNHVLPFLDGEGFEGVRYLYGASMGGYNAGLLATKAPALWGKVALGCPGLFSITPWATPTQLNAYVSRTSPGTVLADVQAGLALLGADYPTVTDWQRNNPMLWVTSLSEAGADYPLFIWYNTGDSMGLEEGARLFRDLAIAEGMTVTERSNGLGHCGQGETLKQLLAEYWIAP